MIGALDSSFCKPSIAQAQQAGAAGYKIWSGYIQVLGNVGLAAPWSQGDFENAKASGGMPIAFCSGWDDPAQLKALAAAWGVRLCVDVEAGIRQARRPDHPWHTKRLPGRKVKRRAGAWLQGFVDASGCGVYGNLAVFPGISAPFFICAAYLGYDPGTTWYGAAPSVPHGWQWNGSVNAFGCGVDMTWLDDWFMTGATSAPKPFYFSGSGG